MLFRLYHRNEIHLFFLPLVTGSFDLSKSIKLNFFILYSPSYFNTHNISYYRSICQPVRRLILHKHIIKFVRRSVFVFFVFCSTVFLISFVVIVFYYLLFSYKNNAPNLNLVHLDLSKTPKSFGHNLNFCQSI